MGHLNLNLPSSTTYLEPFSHLFLTWVLTTSRWATSSAGGLLFLHSGDGDQLLQAGLLHLVSDFTGVVWAHAHTRPHDHYHGLLSAPHFGPPIQTILSAVIQATT
ncbi:hypothetical protein CRG98_009890 [Punica granatum]|uniref:Uncharacterized protein n=1 Tax=Punica granatum TaxID=22663 RepID=A0A2I0KMM6_PUNGR|nr:hypothetical protein CRG98_009890 [Punica granatum]